jgi:hypothetical protein
MSLRFVLKSFDGLPGGATTFDVYLTSGTHAAASCPFFTFDDAVEAIRRLVYECQYKSQYACDVGIEAETGKYVGAFLAAEGAAPEGTHWMRTTPVDTEADARRLIDQIVEEIRQISDGIPYTVAPHDGPTEPSKHEFPA